MHHPLSEKKEQAILVGVITQEQREDQVEEYLDELAFLAETAGAETVKRFTQKLGKPHPKTFVGTGKLQEIVNYVNQEKIGMVIFDDELTPSQTRNIENAFNETKVLDRSKLILDIFAKRARTAAAKTQVELAQYEYLLPRLTRMWTHLSRQKGGIGMRGPGETEIETDRRIVRDKVSLLKKKIKTIDKQMHVQRGNRGKMIRVALVGYTNVGKSTLMNVLSKSKVFAEDKLFATLDTTVRKVVVKNLPFLMSDTVGFIRKLPTQLIESFKSTLDEVREADLLIHVIDISHSNFEEHIESVNKILEEIKSSDKKTIMVFNKIDKYTYDKFDEEDLIAVRDKSNYTLHDWKKTWMSKNEDEVRFISALNNQNIEDLKECLYSEVRKIHITRFPYNKFLYPDC